MQTRGTGPTMVSPLVKGTPDYRSGVLPSAANLQESANHLLSTGEPPDGSLKSKRSNGPVPKRWRRNLSCTDFETVTARPKTLNSAIEGEGLEAILFFFIGARSRKVEHGYGIFFFFRKES